MCSAYMKSKKNKIAKGIRVRECGSTDDKKR